MSSTTPTAHDWSLLTQLLERDSSLSSQLLTILQEERTALEQRDYPRFDALLINKSALVEQLERHLAVRQQHLQQMGFSSDTEALDVARSQFPSVAQVWEGAATLWQSCQQANQINDQISRRTRVVVEQVLDALRGQQSQSTTYDAAGNANRSNSGRTISNA